MLTQEIPVPAQSSGGSNAATPLNGGTGVPAPVPLPAPAAAEGRIHLDVVVSDKSGKPVSGLDLKDFTLLDNNQPAKILSFRPIDQTAYKAHPPVEVILVIDTVNVTHQPVAFMRQEIEKFLRQNGGHLTQPVSVLVLTNLGVDAQPRPSTDGNALAEKVDHLDDRLRTIGNAAGAWGAIERAEFSINMLMTIADAEAKKPGRKLLIWAGSGWPLLDSPNILTSPEGQQSNFDAIVKLSNKLREARISVYSISIGQPSPGTFLYQEFLKGVKTANQANPPNMGLRVFAVHSGGDVQGPDNDLTAQINRSVQNAQAFYTLSFDPPPAAQANEYHDLKVLVDQPKLTARTITGYYNQP
jgi:VWFA-related protein